MKYTALGLTVAGVAAAGALTFTPLAANAQTALHQLGAGNSMASHEGNGAQNGGGKGYQSSLETRAKAVNMTTEQLQTALQTKTMDQIMADQGVSTAAYQAKMTEASKARWEARGLSADEVQSRVEWQQNRQATATHDGTNHQQGGYGRQENN